MNRIERGDFHYIVESCTPGGPGPRGEDRVDAAEEIDRLLKLVKSKKAMDGLKLHFFEGMTFTAIAAGEGHQRRRGPPSRGPRIGSNADCCRENLIPDCRFIQCHPPQSPLSLPTMPTKEERTLAWRMFKSQCITASAKAFQDLFWAVMKAKYGTAFETVAPQGSKGDGGNDGYLPADKHYFQLYAPLTPSEKAGAAAKKLMADFAKLKKHWGGKTGRAVSAFTFVYNDKYEGIPKDISAALNALRTTNKAVALTPFGCADLEAVFLSLPETAWDPILGAAVPDPGRIANLDYGVLADVIRHIVACEVADAETRLDLPPELDEKIKLNRLSQKNSVLIRHGALLTGRIEHYFKSHSAFALSELRDHVVSIFEAAKKAVATTLPQAQIATTDAVFEVFRRGLSPKSATTATATAVDAVIGYFFEACDVFDPNKTAKGRPGASP